jgi:hypothetical protein
MTTATLSNLTVYGMTEKPYYLKEGAGIQAIDNIVIGGLTDTKQQAYFFTDGTDTNAAARILAGDIDVTNAKFGTLATGQTKAVTGLTIGENASATGAGNGVAKPSWLPDAMATGIVFPTSL